MKKLHYFGAKWRKKDVDFLNSLGMDRRIEVGYDSFSIEEGEVYKKIMHHFSGENSLWFKTKPKDYIAMPATAIFNKKELDNAPYYALTNTGESLGDPQPMDSFMEDTFSYDCAFCLTGRKQKSLVRMKKPKLKKKQVNFTLRDYDILFFKKDFFDQVLKPLGLQSKKVIHHKTGNILEDIIQLVIPEAQSKLDIKGGAFREPDSCPRCGCTQYGLQILDFFPKFCDDFEFHICKSIEEFSGGLRRIIISKSFCDLLVKHKVIKFNTNQLIPVKQV